MLKWYDSGHILPPAPANEVAVWQVKQFRKDLGASHLNPVVSAQFR